MRFTHSILCVLCVLCVLCSSLKATPPKLPTPGDPTQANIWGTMLIDYLGQGGIGFDVTHPDFGATGDGETDDTAAIQAAVAAAVAAGGMVYFPPGRYLVSAQLVADKSVRIQGAAQWETTIDCTGFSGTLFDLRGYSTISDLTIDGGAAATGATGIGSTTNFYQCRIERMTFYNLGTCVSVINAWETSIRDVFAGAVTNGFKATMFHGSTIDNLTMNNYDGWALHINRGKAFHVSNIVLETGGTYGLILERCFSGDIDGLYFEGTRDAACPDIYVSAQSGVGSDLIAIRNAYMNSNADTDEAPIWVAAGTGVILENIHWETPVATYHPYYIKNTATSVVFCRNWCNNGGDLTIPLALYNKNVFYDALGGAHSTGESSFLTVIDGSGNLPRAMKFNYASSTFELLNMELKTATDTVVATKTIVKTLDVDDDGSTDDYQFDDDAANTTKQVKTLMNILPAYAELVSLQVRCFETVTGSASMQIDVGTSSGGNELCTGSPDTANDIIGSAAGAAPAMAATSAARSLYVSGTPGANWNTLNAGRWSIMLTYIDYAAVHGQKNP